jgi:hypothetical protein
MAQERVPDAGGMEPSPAIAQDITSDQQLVADILRRDRKATAQFVARYSDAIYAYVRHRLSPPGLDPVTARRIRQVIREARAGGATVFLTTHDMVTANAAVRGR